MGLIFGKVVPEKLLITSNFSGITGTGCLKLRNVKNLKAPHLWVLRLAHEGCQFLSQVGIVIQDLEADPADHLGAGSRLGNDSAF